MRRICRAVVLGFALLYLAALAVLGFGLSGWFSEPDPLAGIYVILLGQPWVTYLDRVPQAALPWVAALLPLINLGILAAFCRWAGRRR